MMVSRATALQRTWSTATPPLAKRDKSGGMAAALQILCNAVALMTILRAYW